MTHTRSVGGLAMPMVLGQPALEAVRLCGVEGVNRLFKYELLFKTLDALNFSASLAADFDLDAFIGREICCSIELDGNGAFVAGTVGAAVDRIGAGGNPVIRWPGRNSADREGAVHADNLLRPVEIKFPGDDWTRGQETAYQQIAGGKNRMSVLDVSDCNGDLEEAKRNSGATNPRNAPIFFPPPDNVPPPDAIPVPAGDDAEGEGTKDKEPKGKGPKGIPVRVPARSVTPIAEKVWYEPWLNEMDNARTEVARAVASLWDDTRDGLSTMSTQARDWARAHAPWLVEAGRWMRDTGSKTWQWIDATGRKLYSYTDAQLRAMWAMVQEATDLTWDMLKAIDWGQVVTLVKNVAKGLCVLALIVVGAYVVYVLAAAVFAALAALVALASAASAAGAAALAMLGAALGVGLATAP